MHKMILTLLLSLYIQGICAQDTVTLQQLSFADFKPYLHQESDTVHVVNFWATWCAPCVKELPYFERLSDEFQPLKVVLVSLDFKNQVESKLIPFLKDHEIRSQVIYLDETNANAWIDLVEPTWSGALPATLIYREGKREFIEGSFADYQELTSIIETFHKT